MANKGATRKGVLNARQLKFVDEYLVDMNATQAAIRAGYSKKTAGSQGFDLLKHPEIASAIQARRQEVSHKTGITVEKVLAEMARIAFSDVRKLFGPTGALLPLTELPDDVAPAIAAIEVSSHTPPGEGAVPEWTTKVKLWDKGKQLENLLKHLGAEGGKPDAPANPMGATPGLDAFAAKLALMIPLAAA
jgi:phage terminase small subunit